MIRSHFDWCFCRNFETLAFWNDMLHRETDREKGASGHSEGDMVGVVTSHGTIVMILDEGLMRGGYSRENVIYKTMV